jgi:hypothetical protein
MLCKGDKYTGITPGSYMLVLKIKYNIYLNIIFIHFDPVSVGLLCFSVLFLMNLQEKRIQEPRSHYFLSDGAHFVIHLYGRLLLFFFSRICIVTMLSPLPSLLYVGALRHSLQDRLSKGSGGSGRGRAEEIYLKLLTSTGMLWILPILWEYICLSWTFMIHLP